MIRSNPPANDYATAQGYLRTYKVDELKQACRNAGLRVSGNKTDLQERLRSQLDASGSEGAASQKIITSIIKVRTAPPPVPPSPTYPTYTMSARPAGFPIHGAGYHFPYVAHIPPPPSEENFCCICNVSRQLVVDRSSVVQCRSCKSFLHLNCFSLRPNEINSYHPWDCFYCKSNKFGSYQSVNTTLAKVNLRQHMRVGTSFQLKEDQLKFVKDKENPNNVRLLCLSSNNADLSHGLPYNAILKVNGVVVPTNANRSLNSQVHPGSVSKSSGELLNDFIYPEAEKINIVEIENSYDLNTPLVLVIQLVSIYTVESLVQTIKKNNALSFEEGKKDVCSSFSGGGDEECAATSTKISLRDNLSLARIVNPGRGKQCTHAQCFDLTTYIEFYSQPRATPLTNAWKCPVCYKDCKADTLIFDCYFEKILATTKDSGAYSVEVFADASWKLINDKLMNADDDDDDYDDDDDSIAKDKSKAKPTKPVEIISLDEEDRSTSPLPISTNLISGNNGQPITDVADFLADMFNNEEPPAVRKPPSTGAGTLENPIEL